MATKQNQNGSIYYEKDRNRWRCRYQVIDSETSKIKYKTKIFSTEKEAQEFFSTLQYQKGNTLYVQNNVIPPTYKNLNKLDKNTICKVGLRKTVMLYVNI